MPVKLYSRTEKVFTADHLACRLLHDEGSEWTSAQGNATARLADDGETFYLEQTERRGPSF